MQKTTSGLCVLTKTYKLMTTLLLAAMVFSLGFAKEVRADGVTYIAKNGQTLVLDAKSKNYEISFFLMIKGRKDTEDIVSIRSSNKAIVNAINEFNECYVSVNKAGKARITVTFKDKKTRAIRNATVNFVIIKKFSSPFKKLVIGGKKYKMSRRQDYLSITTKKSSVKISYKLKKNWKMVKKSGYLNPFNKPNVIKNGSKIKAEQSKLLYFKNTKTKEEASLAIDVYP